MQRPYRKQKGKVLKFLARSFWDDFDQLALVAYELQFRTYVDKTHKADVIERLMQLGQAGRVAQEAEPGFELPSTDVKETRRRAQRLEKLANTLASFARTFKKHPADMAAAIDDWESDLRYLKETFYDEWGGFPWPDVPVDPEL